MFVSGRVSNPNLGIFPSFPTPTLAQKALASPKCPVVCEIFSAKASRKNDGEGGEGDSLAKNLPWNTKKRWVGDTDTMMICICIYMFL